MGKQPLRRGCAPDQNADVAKAVVAYGGSARAGSVPGNLFIVDPNFLSYTSEPIEVTVVVRRNPGNDNSGFKLVYESPKGFKTAGTWYTVPDNKEWHTKTWRIEDPPVRQLLGLQLRTGIRWEPVQQVPHPKCDREEGGP